MQHRSRGRIVQWYTSLDGSTAWVVEPLRGRPSSAASLSILGCVVTDIVAFVGILSARSYYDMIHCLELPQQARFDYRFSNGHLCLWLQKQVFVSRHDDFLFP